MTRRADIKRRLRADMMLTFSEHSTIPDGALSEALLDDAMFVIEHLLDHIEGIKVSRDCERC